MGWKKFKKHFGIKHIVQVDGDTLQIGSGYVSDLASIDMKTGETRENRTFAGFLRKQYPDLPNATPAEIASILQDPDEFGASITVYTSRGGEVLEKQCEAIGYPNVTHDGELMYDNTFFVDKSAAVTRAKGDARYSVRIAGESVESVKRNLAECIERLERGKEALAKLEAQYPDTPGHAGDPDQPE